jgi:hypothetical protein
MRSTAIGMSPSRRARNVAWGTYTKKLDRGLAGTCTATLIRTEATMNTQKTETAAIPKKAQAPIDKLVDRTIPKDRTLSQGAPSKELLGVLPLARLIPQDIHSVMDYLDGFMAGSGSFMADEDDRAARIASLALGASVIGISAMTNYRLSIAKIVPIEVHEVADYLWGAAAIAAPFVLGYWKSSPRTAWTHIMVGAGTILTSLFTDYRSAKRRR